MTNQWTNRLIGDEQLPEENEYVPGQELESTLYKHIKENPSLKDGFSDVFLFNELFYAYYYLNTQQPQRAYEHLVKAKEYQNENNYFILPDGNGVDLVLNIKKLAPNVEVILLTAHGHPYSTAHRTARVPAN